VLVKDYAAINRKWWNNATPAHAGSKFYDIPRFIKGKTSLQSIEIDELGKVRGKTLLHLLCHFGMDTLSWARKGAITTGVDISDSSIRLAKKLSRQTGIPSTFICSDIYELPKILDKKFDITIDLSIENNLFNNYLIRFSHSDFSIGFEKHNSDKYYNFQVKPEIISENSYKNLLNSIRMF